MMSCLQRDHEVVARRQVHGLDGVEAREVVGVLDRDESVPSFFSMGAHMFFFRKSAVSRSLRSAGIVRPARSAKGAL